KSTKRLSLQIFIQAKKAIDEADLIIFMVDITEPVSVMDREIAQILRKSEKEIIFVGNKWDDPGRDLFTEDYLEFGLDYPVKISAIHGKNIGDLLDVIAEKLPAACIDKDELEHDGLPVISILGRPNVGKSTLFNTFIREERAIVDDIEGTTRDSIDSIVTIREKRYKFIDTAGLKKSKMSMDDLEYYSKLRTERAAGESDIALILIDCGARKITRQDVNIAEMCIDKGLSICIVLSKIDLVNNEELEKLIKELDQSLRFAHFIPVLKISANTKKGLGSLVKMIDKLMEERTKKISDNKLTAFLKDKSQEKAVFIKGKHFKVKFAKQIKSSPPSFLIFSNMDAGRKINIRKYVENNIREEFGFMGAPIFLKFKY
ncbi:MAG: ribosome biogenesis GTPase Der, partial [Actinobacteria bacterium]|nr:ribosome biogenesis GTPase Der [Actinomycetota bacterium]